MNDEIAARAIASIYEIEKKRARRELTPDQTIATAHHLAQEIRHAAERGEAAPGPRPARSPLLRLLPCSSPDDSFQVYADQIKTADSIDRLLGRFGWSDRLSDATKLEVGTQILVSLRERFPNVIGDVRVTPKFLKHFVDRHGIPRWYYRRAGQPDRPLKGQPGEREFHKAYRTAHAESERALRATPVEAIAA